MDQTTNPLQRILDLTLNQNSLLFHFQQQNSCQLENLSFLGLNESKNMERNQFFIQSPNPLRKQRKNSVDSHYDLKQHNMRSQQFSFNKKINFDEQSSMFKFFGNQKQSQIICPQSSFTPRKRGYLEFSMNQQRNLLDQNDSQTQLKSDKNQRGLKNLSQLVYQIVKKQGRTTFNDVSTQLVQNIKRKAIKQEKQLYDRDQKNIKRRAYDALNVMISSDIIDKVDKFISLKSPLKNIVYRTNQKKNSKVKSSKQVYNQFKNILIQKQKNIDLKILQLSNLQQRKENIQKFFEEKKSKKIKSYSNKIIFPFLCIKTDLHNFTGISHNSGQVNRRMWQKQNSSTCDQFSEQNCIYLNFNFGDLFSNVKLQGDIDFISSIGK